MSASAKAIPKTLTTLKIDTREMFRSIFTFAYWQAIVQHLSYEERAKHNYKKLSSLLSLVEVRHDDSGNITIELDISPAKPGSGEADLAEDQIWGIVRKQVLERISSAHANIVVAQTKPPATTVSITASAKDWQDCLSTHNENKCKIFDIKEKFNKKHQQPLPSDRPQPSPLQLQDLNADPNELIRYNLLIWQAKYDELYSAKKGAPDGKAKDNAEEKLGARPPLSTEAKTESAIGEPAFNPPQRAVSVVALCRETEIALQDSRRSAPPATASRTLTPSSPTGDAPGPAADPAATRRDTSEPKQPLTARLKDDLTAQNKTEEIATFVQSLARLCYKADEASERMTSLFDLESTARRQLERSTTLQSPVDPQTKKSAEIIAYIRAAILGCKGIAEFRLKIGGVIDAYQEFFSKTDGLPLLSILEYFRINLEVQQNELELSLKALNYDGEQIKKKLADLSRNEAFSRIIINSSVASTHQDSFHLAKKTQQELRIIVDLKAAILDAFIDSDIIKFCLAIDRIRNEYKKIPEDDRGTAVSSFIEYLLVHAKLAQKDLSKHLDALGYSDSEEREEQLNTLAKITHEQLSHPPTDPQAQQKLLQIITETKMALLSAKGPEDFCSRMQFLTDSYDHFLTQQDMAGPAVLSVLKNLHDSINPAVREAVEFSCHLGRQ